MIIGVTTSTVTVIRIEVAVCAFARLAARFAVLDELFIKPLREFA